MFFLKSHGHKLFLATLGLVASVLFLRITCEALFNSPEVISDDYFEWIATVDTILSGNAKGWTDCAYGSHIAVIPLIIWVLNAKFLHWNLFAERLLGLMVSLAKIGLMATFFLPLVRSKFLTVAILFAVCFSITQVTVYVYPVASTVFGLATFFFLIGLSILDSACAKSSNSRATNLGFILTSVLSCLCAGILIPAFCSYLSLIVIHRRFTLLKCWLLAATLSSLPYLAVILNFKRASTNTLSTFNPVRILDMLGSLTTSDLSQISIRSIWTYTSQGFLGIVFALYLVCILLKELKAKNKTLQGTDSATLSRAEALAISFIVFGLSSAVTLGAFRDAVAQWHVSITSFFWLGLLFLILKTIFSDSEQTTLKTKIVCSSILTFLCICLAKANLNLAPYDYTYRARNAAAETFVQQYKSTPTYNFQFLNGGEIIALSKIYKTLAIAEKNEWLTFRQTLPSLKSLQSAFFQPEVLVEGPDGSSGLSWVKNKRGQLASPICPAKLRFELSKGTSVCWSPFYPNCNIRNFEVKTDSKPAPLRIEISKNKKVIKQISSKFQRLKLTLNSPANSETKIRVTALENCKIDEMVVELEPLIERNQAWNSLPLPNNVDRPIDRNKQHVEQIEINSQNYDFENLVEEKRSEGLKTFQVTGPSPKLILKNSLSLPFSRLESIRYTLKVPRTLAVPRSCIHVILNGYELKTMATAVLEDGQPHTYDFDTKFFQPAASDIITGLQIMPIYVDKSKTPIELDNVEIVYSDKKI